MRNERNRARMEAHIKRLTAAGFYNQKHTPRGNIPWEVRQSTRRQALENYDRKTGNNGPAFRGKRG